AVTTVQDKVKAPDQRLGAADTLITLVVALAHIPPSIGHQVTSSRSLIAHNRFSPCFTFAGATALCRSLSLRYNSWCVPSSSRLLPRTRAHNSCAVRPGKRRTSASAIAQLVSRRPLSVISASAACEDGGSALALAGAQ